MMAKTFHMGQLKRRLSIPSHKPQPRENLDHGLSLRRMENCAGSNFEERNWLSTTKCDVDSFMRVQE